MHNQPTPSTSISPVAAALLAVAVLSTTALTGLVVAQMVAPIHVYLGTPVLLGVAATLAGGGFLTHLALGQVLRRLDELERRIGDLGGSVDAETAAAARRLNMRLLSSQN